MSDTQGKPREFWIIEQWHDYYGPDHQIEGNIKKGDGKIHVIEFSAYQNLKDSYVALVQGRADTIKLAEDILVRALDAIGNMDSAIRPLLTSRDIKEVTRNALGQWNKEKGEG